MSSSDRNDDDDDDRQRRRRRDDFDDDDDRPRRSDRRYDERDDFDDYPQRKQGDGLGITAMILGIVSCVMSLGGLCCIVFTGLSVLSGIVGVILGFTARAQNPTSGSAKAGIITGFIGLGLSVIMIVLLVVLQFGLGR